MESPILTTKWDKINLVVSHLMSGPDCGWLILVGTGGDGKSMATNEAVKLWRRSLGEDVDLYPSCEYSGVLKGKGDESGKHEGEEKEFTKKFMRTNTLFSMWKKPANSEIVYLDSHTDGSIVKIVLMKKGEKIVKTIIHANTWGPELEFMAKEWGAKVARFERGTEPA
jgi:hypothetical protein